MFTWSFASGLICVLRYRARQRRRTKTIVTPTKKEK
jgi:hypothetical protein